MQPFLFLRSRRAGYSHLLILTACEKLKQGGSVMIAAIHEDQSILNAYSRVLNEQGISHTIDRRTRKSPSSPVVFDYDQFGEIINTRLIEQADIFRGWLIAPIK